jgi:hypothetical protein
LEVADDVLGRWNRLDLAPCFVMGPVKERSGKTPWGSVWELEMWACQRAGEVGLEGVGYETGRAFWAVTEVSSWIRV